MNIHLVNAYKEYMQVREQCRNGLVGAGAVAAYRERLRTMHRLIAGKPLYGNH